MPKPTPLHALVHALTPAEKRYFKLFAGRHAGEKPNAVRLFDAILAQPEYDEQALKRTFAGEPFARHLPSEKHYLDRRIREALESWE